MNKQTDKVCAALLAAMRQRLTNCEGSVSYDETTRRYEIVIRNGDHYVADRLPNGDVNGMLRNDDQQYMDVIASSLASRLGRQSFMKVQS